MANRVLQSLFLCFLLYSCSQLEKAEEFIAGLPPEEQYKKDENISDEIFEIWQNRKQKGLDESLQIELPYLESGTFKPRNFGIYSYETYMMPGEILEAEVITDSSSTLVFTDIYKKEPSSESFYKVHSGDAVQKVLKFEIKEKGLYKLIFQPEIEANTPFQIKIQRSPAYTFPVAEGENSDIGSYWGDIRDGGKREHKGIDIFATRGTPVLAAVEGRIRFSGEKGLGGKQVWLWDRRRKQSLYYAHLDSIVPDIKKVKAGDTLGFVGNTGNAEFTPSHLHFGIYKKGQGAVDPLGYVHLPGHIGDENISKEEFSERLTIATHKAGLRKKPSSSNSKLIKTGVIGEILYVQGKSTEWFHVRDSQDRPMFIHESQVKSVN
ncbi:M23 family metallopeptidase [Christiangramia sabulilitoris]|uniref:M23 family metallopeptidase n=1 Tax=Christiangramia sabulilitoris TaxID=2583991 RepID=A0A550I0H0_9FLAO|nr:M23 family metallopeptidase [Christiangramia sabulilitoris]TRO64471.1 M23 family metallopeptidase [Christiangramia sabulilitoris]